MIADKQESDVGSRLLYSTADSGNELSFLRSGTMATRIRVITVRKLRVVMVRADSFTETVRLNRWSEVKEQL